MAQLSRMRQPMAPDMHHDEDAAPGPTDRRSVQEDAGLALVAEIAHKHGGTAVCLAAEGGGSRFRITLPTA